MTDTIAAHEDGSVWTRWTKGKGAKISNEWRQLTYYAGPKWKPRRDITIPYKAAKLLGSNTLVIAGRFNLACYLGRVLESHEVCRHGPGGNSDHSKANLSVGCQLNNIIDEVESGRIKTTPEQLKTAIHRLNALLKKEEG